MEILKKQIIKYFTENDSMWRKDNVILYAEYDLYNIVSKASPKRFKISKMVEQIVSPLTKLFEDNTFP